MFLSYISVTLIIAVCITAIVYHLRRREHYKPLLKFPGKPPTFMFGSLSWFRSIYSKAKSLKYPPSVYISERMLEEATRYQKTGMHCAWIGPFPTVYIYKAEIVKLILSSSVSIHKNYNNLMKWLGAGLLTSTGEKWRQDRKLLTPCFHFRILEDLFPVFNKHSLILVEKLKSHKDKDYVDMTPFTFLCTLDIICETIMGVSIEAQKGSCSEYVHVIHNILGIIKQRSYAVWLRWDFLFDLTKMGKLFNRYVDFLHNFTEKVIKDRKEMMLLELNSSKTDEKSEETDRPKKLKMFLDLLLQLNMNGEQLTERDIREQVDTFMFEGHDTTGSGLLFTLYCIGLYPEIQKNISKELNEIFDGDIDRPVTLEDTRKMKYMECVIKESLRLYPPVPMFQRKLGEDIHFEGLKIPRGTTVSLNALALHRNSENFPNPEMFDPERFLPQNASGRHPYAYIPFSAGPRNCIGQKFAMMAMKTILSNVLRHFDVISLDTRDKLPVASDIVLKPAEEVRLKFLPKT